jgi:hypothetical protein
LYANKSVDTLQRHNAKNSKQIFPEKELGDLIPNFHIHVSMSDLYIHTYRSAYYAAGKYVERSWEYIQ